MGLYDDVSVPIELLKAQEDERIKKYAALLTGVNVDFQTKSLDCCMQEYVLKKIEDKYVLHKENVERECVESPDSKSIFKFHFVEKSRTTTPELITATLSMCDYYNSDTLDIFIDLKMELVAGVVTSIVCALYEERDPAPRLQRNKEMVQKMKESAIYYKSFRGRAAIVLRRALFAIHKKIDKCNGWLQRLAFKL